MRTRTNALQRSAEGLIAALGDQLAASFSVWCASHAERGCVTGATLSPGGLVIGECWCTCEDHGCAAIAAEKRGGYAFCQVCRDTRHVRAPRALGAAGFGQASRCPECNGPGMAHRVEYLKLSSGIPWEWFETRRFDLLDLDSTARIGALGWWGHDRKARPTLVLSGSPGTGKTHSAVALAASAIRDDLTVAFTEVADLVNLLRASQRDGAQLTRDQVLHSYRSAALVILDDLGAGRWTEFAYEELFGLINHRTSRAMLTIITTNVSRASAPDGDRLWSRVFGDRFSYVVSTDGPDRRRNGEGA